jgi:hypothetical protein
MAYEILRDKEPPEKQHRRGREPVYPFADMAIGDSFIITEASKASVYHAASMYRCRHAPWCFQLQKDDEGNLRLWRVQDAPLWKMNKGRNKAYANHYL